MSELICCTMVDADALPIARYFAWAMGDKPK